MFRAIILGAILAASGCQGTPIGDAMIGKEKLAQMDDEYCRSIGAKPETPMYIQCRMYKTAERDRGHQAAYQRAGAGFANAGQSYGNAMQNNASTYRAPVNCRSVRAVDGAIRTNCQ